MFLKYLTLYLIQKGVDLLKRTLDLFLIILSLPFVLPIYLLITLLVLTQLNSPVLFRQSRPGLNRKIFNIYKFRTMTNECDKNGILLSDELRLTKFGKFLRSTSLDELPSLLNVLKNDMSLVGPRPLLVEYLSFYSTQQTRRHEVKPGITGWTQVNGRNAINWNEKFDLDVWYVDNQSIWLDIKILFLTIKKVIMRDGISAKNSATMPPFKGTKK